jgi:hypothetical protein
MLFSSLYLSAIRTMFAADTANVGAAAAKEIAEVLPMPGNAKRTTIDFDKIRRVHNVRTVRMEEQNAKRLLPSIRDNGFLPAYPLMVEEMADGTYNLLAGHGRTAALRLLTKEQRATALAEFHGKVPAIVYKNLTEVGRAAVRSHDFTAASDKMKGDKWTEYQMIKDFILAGGKDKTRNGRVIGDATIAAFMGWLDGKGEPNRNRVYGFRKLHELSAKVPGLEDEYAKKWDTSLPENERLTALPDKAIDKLFPQLSLDMTGETAREMFAGMISGDPESVEVDTKPHSLDPKAARDLAKKPYPARVIRLILALTHQPTGKDKPVESVDDVVAEIAALETAALAAGVKAEAKAIAAHRRKLQPETPVHPATLLDKAPSEPANESEPAKPVRGRKAHAKAHSKA